MGPSAGVVFLKPWGVARGSESNPQRNPGCRAELRAAHRDLERSISGTEYGQRLFEVTRNSQ